MIDEKSIVFRLLYDFYGLFYEKRIVFSTQKIINKDLYELL